jgi:hypothetical protein
VNRKLIVPLAFVVLALPGLAGCPKDGSDPCVPQCDGRTCGDDQCGATCGDCTGGLCTDGVCCIPQCDGRTCGEDGCGGTCGVCANACSGVADDPALCTDGTCGQACCPSCDGKTCGDDGCGGSCGTCDAGTCFEGACCVPSCQGKVCGDDGCGGPCGSACGDGLECREGACKVPCGRTGFEPRGTVSSWKPYGSSKDGTLFYQAVDSDDSPASVMTLDIRQAGGFAGPLGPGTYPFATTKYSKCDICIRMAEDCSDQGCARQYLATEGVLEIKALDRADGPFEAILHDVLFREALIDLDWASWVPPSGQTWCVDDLALKADKVQLAVPQSACVADSADVLMDQNIGDFSLTNCLGDTVSLHSLCGQAKAAWFLLVAAWCPYCSEYAPQAAQTYEDMKPAVQLLTVLGEDTSGNSPSMKACAAYAKSHNLDPAWTFIDFEWEKTLAHIYPYGFQGIPYEMVLDGDNMAYVWSTGQRGDLGTVLESLSNQP